tara:strand:+ start:53 stop:1201 length:1149 start_codon:yes stop_codon:yes gene_type:complete
MSLLCFIIFLVAPTFSHAENVLFSSKVDLIFESITDKNTAGCSIGVIKSGEFIHRAGYGMANLEHNIPNTTDTVFRIGSVSKQFTAMAIALLEEQGVIDINTPIHDYIEDLIPYKDVVTINHLVHHFSGLGDYEYSDYPGRFINAVDEEFRWGNEDYMSNEEIYSLFKTLPLIMQPETKFWYSNLGYGLLTIIIENTTGMSLRQYAESQIFAPLDMKNTFFNDNVNLIVKNRADGYSTDEDYPGQYIINMTNLSNVGDGGVYTTINDFINWDNNFYANKLGNTSPSLNVRMGQNFYQVAGLDSKIHSSKDRDANSYAFAQNQDTKYGFDRWSHSGSWVAYTAHYSRFPSIEFSVVTLCNNQDIDAEDIAEEVMSIFFDGVID